MKESSTHWTKEDLKIYILICCSNADFVESKKEIEYIKSKIKSSNFDKIHAEFEEDNDYQSIQKIQDALKVHQLEDKDELIQEIKELFLVDHHFDAVEENLLLGLKHMLK